MAKVFVEDSTLQAIKKVRDSKGLTLNQTLEYLLNEKASSAPALGVSIGNILNEIESYTNPEKFKYFQELPLTKQWDLITEAVKDKVEED